jgi:potassium efflux system protein
MRANRQIPGHAAVKKYRTLQSTVMVALILASSLTLAQDVALPDLSAATDVTAEQLDAAVEALESTEGLDEQLRTDVAEQLRNARTQVQNRIASEAAALAFSESLVSAPAETEALQAALETEPSAPTAASLGIDDATEVEELTQLLSQALADQVSAESRFVELEAQLEVQTGRPAVARNRIGELRSSRDELAAVMQLPPAPGEAQLLTNARRLNTELRRAAQAAEINKLEQELVSHSVRLDLLRLQLEQAERTRLEVSRRVELLRSLVNDRRQAAAEQAQESATTVELEAADKHAVIRAVAEDYARLTRELPNIAANIEQATIRLERANNEAQELEQRLARSEQRLEVAGLSRALGLLMVEESRDLPQVSQYRSQVRQRSNLLAEVGLAQLRIREHRRELRSVDTYVDELLAEVAQEISGTEELGEIRTELRALLRNQRDLLAQADNSYSSYLQVLGDLDTSQRRLLDVAIEYRDFLNQNLLWIPSAPIAFTGKWEYSADLLSTAFSPHAWASVVEDLLDSIRVNVGASIFAALLFAGLLISRRPLSQRVRTMNQRVGRLKTDNIGLTLAALGAAALRALPASLFLATLAWFLVNAPDRSQFAGTVGGGLFAVAPFLYNLLLFRVLCAEQGVLQIHFRWQKKNLAVIRRHLDRLVAIGAPLVFAVFLFYTSEAAFDRATIGRLLFIALLILFIMTLRPLAHPRSGVAASYYKKYPDTWLSKLRWVWYGLAAGIPVVIGALTILGYLYTSVILTGLLVDSIWLALALILVNLVVLRWVALTHRKLALKQRLEERESARAATESAEDADNDGEAPAVESRPLDLEAVDVQTRKLLRWGLVLVAIIAAWGIWSDVLPAFRLLDQVALWSQTVVVDGVETIAPVTLADVLLAILLAIGTAVASRNLPGLMEIAVLQRLTLQPGSRYAINTLVRYVVVTIGVVAVLNTIGWNWSQIQWLVAALSVGLGFGLQEIVANFVSGLIILFERPVRVGDTVTVGQLTGTVSRVQIRATTITDWDRKEIIVPNKAFITEQVVNWTLADPITRIVVPVGISYGSDVEVAHKVMQDTLHSLPLVLDDPEPRVYFVGFGESSLDFNLYVHSRQLADRLPLMHAVHEAILRALRENGIEIPFPQRDLHIRSTVEQDTPPENR